MEELPWPFIGSEALGAGAVPERALRRLYQHVYPDVYIPRGAEITASQRAHAAWLWSRRRGVVAGQSAAALLGARWVDPRAPAELVYTNVRPPPLIAVRNDRLLPFERLDVSGVAVTTPARTAFDIGRRTPRPAAIAQLDALANATGLKSVDVEAVIAQHKGARDVGRLRRVLCLVDGGAESPAESRTRLALIDAGLPKPQTQIRVFDQYGDFVARIDMGWEEFRVGVEYDGAAHWTDSRQRAHDIDRLAALESMGWAIVRVSDDLLTYRSGTVVGRVAAALRAAGWNG
jgi:very-short-patch-repair endonuclease